MSEWRRTIRTTPRIGLRLDDGLATVFAGELLDPSPELWIVSPWVSDVPVLDNSDQDFDVVLGDGFVGPVAFTTVLARLAELGSMLHLVVKPDDHNRDFVDRLSRRVFATHLDVHHAADVHEKTLCGSNWVVSGSMNFTWRGFEVNEESVVYEVDPALAAQSRLDFEHRWPRS